MQGMPDIAIVIIAYKTCTCYSVLSKSQAKSAFTDNVCQGLNTTDRQIQDFGKGGGRFYAAVKF